MLKRNPWVLIVAFSIFLTLLLALNDRAVFAQGRLIQSVNDSATVLYRHWQLAFQSDETPACDILIEHEGQPTQEEMRHQCGEMLTQAFINSSKCQNSLNIPICAGVALQEIGVVYTSKPEQEPVIKLSLSGCNYAEGAPYCIGGPSLVLQAENPQSTRSIIRISGKYNGRDFSCEGATCELGLVITDPQGWLLVFRGDYGGEESTSEFDVVIRVRAVSGINNAFSIEIAGDTWNGGKVPACSDIWWVFPKSSDSPSWLSAVNNVTDLNSRATLYYLAASLIKSGIVDASSCVDSGLANSYTANECGLAMATPKMNQWQNQFDQEILNVAQEDNIPPLLLKNLFLRESQIWPGTYHDIKEVGFGQITENGADALLLWNKEFYNFFCPLALDRGVCSKGYTNLSDERKALLRGALLRSSNASCPKCDSGIDELKANYSIHIFAETIRANCAQVSQLVSNITQKPVRGLVGYEDLWRFTLVNYNAGSGCLGNALERTWGAKQPIDWDHVMPNIDPACQSAVEYVVDISDNETKNISSFSTPPPTATVITTPSPTPTLDTTPT